MLITELTVLPYSGLLSEICPDYLSVYAQRLNTQVAAVVGGYSERILNQEIVNVTRNVSRGQLQLSLERELLR